MKNEHFVNSQFQSLVIIPEHFGVIHVSTIFKTSIADKIPLCKWLKRNYLKHGSDFITDNIATWLTKLSIKSKNVMTIGGVVFKNSVAS